MEGVLSRASEYPLLLLAAALSCGCGGRAQGQPPGDDGGSGDDAGLSFDASDAGWTQCTSPGGYAVCKGPESCSTGGTCQSCSNTASTEVVACTNEALASFNQTANECGSPCLDGSICVALLDDATFFCAPFEMGVLFAQNGGSNRARYADMGLWTGQELPLPTTCPTVDGLQLCGGNCGPCPGGQLCTGRSPLHPYSFCVPPYRFPCSLGSHNCGVDAGTQGQGCLTFTVEPEAQSLADRWGICLPGPLCQAAASLPGGATCSL
jgi:hypothetical protein